MKFQILRYRGVKFDVQFVGIVGEGRCLCSFIVS